ncbi:MAG: AAA family ATPase [Sphingobacteriales bacterium]|nr:AAA family ATPase [Sphingobacteriales bacterium]
MNEIKNSDSLLLQKFKPENVKYLGRGSSQKDKTIAIILAKDNRRKDLTEVIGIKELYDCLMCKYDVEDSETQYWVVNGLEKEKIEFCLENSVFVMQFQYGIQRNSVVSRQLNKAKKVKEGDKVLLFNENRYYAYGTFIKCEIESTKEKTLAEQVDNKTKNENGEIITYTDAPCYFEDLTDTNGFDGKFGQRLSIDSWENSNTDGLSIPGIMENIDFIQDTILKLKDDTFYKLVKNTLSGEIKNIMELEKIKELTELLEYKSQIILQGPPGTGKTYTAKDIAEVMIFEDLTPDKKLQKKKLEESNQFKLVQFHPSYSYEDFVRGITSEVGNSAVPEFVTKNKIFCEFATIAYKNFIDSQNHLTELSFGNHESSPSTKTELKKFVLIIDEINRANLPSVLGELIYALEYRGDTVESMYEIKGEGRTIIVPPNLYVIGTMNTADRSVGHIDYAIKRRFAFKNVLPNEDVITNEKAKELFKLVSILFEKDYLAPDFNKEDVQIGHSYFIVKDENELKLKIQYEIAPLLNEYVKDGLLMENAKVYIKTKIMNFVV